jgi:hypothetical protein
MSQEVIRMVFERFTKTGRGYTPKVSIWTRGQIGFNQGAVERFKLRDFNFAVLYYDRDERKIGVQFTNIESEEGANKVVKGKTGIFISAKAFLDYYDITHSKTKKYNVSYDTETGIYVIKLD